MNGQPLVIGGTVFAAAHETPATPAAKRPLTIHGSMRSRTRTGIFDGRSSGNLPKVSMR